MKSGYILLMLMISACSSSDFSGKSNTSKNAVKNNSNGTPSKTGTTPPGETESGGKDGDILPDTEITTVSDLTPAEQLARGKIFDENGTLCEGKNLVLNSDFEKGHVDFTSEYIWQTVPNDGYLPGPSQRYTINSNPNANHRGYQNDPEDRGKMLVINLAASGQFNFWCQKLETKKNTLYQISVRMRKAVTTTTQSSLSEWTIDRNVFTGQFDPQGRWGQFNKTWLAEKDATVELCGRNLAAHVESGDLVVDDVTFKLCP